MEAEIGSLSHFASSFLLFVHVPKRRELYSIGEETRGRKKEEGENDSLFSRGAAAAALWRCVAPSVDGSLPCAVTTYGIRERAGAVNIKQGAHRVRTANSDYAAMLYGQLRS